MTCIGKGRKIAKIDTSVGRMLLFPSQRSVHVERVLIPFPAVRVRQFVGRLKDRGSGPGFWIQDLMRKKVQQRHEIRICSIHYICSITWKIRYHRIEGMVVLGDNTSIMHKKSFRTQTHNLTFADG